MHKRFCLAAFAVVVAFSSVEIAAADSVHSSSWRKARLAEAFPAKVREQIWLADYAAIDAATERGWLVTVPHDPLGLGVTPRRDGRSPVGEREPDPELRERLFRLSKPAAGLLYQIAEYLRIREREDFAPLEVNSLVRPWTYQKRLMGTNANANTARAGVPPTHVFGLAFDIPRKDMPLSRQKLIESYLRELEVFGQAIYFKEGRQATFHVVAMPEAWADLEREYRRFVVAAADRRDGLDATVDAAPLAVSPDN